MAIGDGALAHVARVCVAQRLVCPGLIRLGMRALHALQAARRTSASDAEAKPSARLLAGGC